MIIEKYRFSLFLLVLFGFIYLGSFTEWLWDTKKEDAYFQAALEDTLRKDIEKYEEVVRIYKEFFNNDIKIWPNPIHPDDYDRLTSPFGYRLDPFKENTGGAALKYHPALDMTGVIGARVLSLTEGIVENKWYDRGWHNGRWYSGHPYFNGYIQIRLENGWLLSYGHVDAIIVKEGDIVVAGQIICRISEITDKHSTGPHLHFSIQDEAGEYLQPQKYIEMFREIK